MARPFSAVAAAHVVTVDLPPSAASAERPSHHANDRQTAFVNPWPSFKDHDVRFGLQIPYQILTKMDRQPMPPKDQLVPVRKPDWGGAGPSAQLRATWLGHAAYLVEFPAAQGAERGMRVLFDPVFSHRCSPFSFIGPARYTPPPCKVEDLPDVDVVIISHSHYDHMDLPTLKHLARKQDGKSVAFVAPLGNRKWFIDNLGIDASRAIEMDWWNEASVTVGSIGKLRLTCTPSQHFAGRGAFDRNTTLWASFAVEQLDQSGGDQPISSIWFGGDTGYRTVPEKCSKAELDKLPVCPAFAEIGRKFSARRPFDLAFIPIGAYSLGGDVSFFSRVHASPEDAVLIHKDVRAKRSLPIHYGTWVLTDELVTEPPIRLAQAANDIGLPDSEFRALDGIGVTATVDV